MIKTKKPPEGGLIVFMAGDEGVEPPHTESESAVLPLDESPISGNVLTFGELWTFTCFMQTDFLTLNFTRISSQETGFMQIAA